MTFYNLIKSRQSVRKYLNKSIEQDKLDIILESALSAPSSKNSKSWEFIVIENRTDIQKLANCRINGSKFLAESPLAIVVLGDLSKSDVWIENASIASTIIQLQAEELGIGSCWIQIRDRMYNEHISSNTYIKELLQIPDNFEVLCIISLGYAADNIQTKIKTIDLSKIHRNHF